MPPAARKPDARRHWAVRSIMFRRFRRRYRWLVRIGLVAPVVVFALLVIVSRSPLTRMIVVNQLGKTLNVWVEADSAYVEIDGTLVVDRARFRAPGVPGPAGEFLSIAQLEAEVDWWSVLWGTPRIRQVRVLQPLVTISQSIDGQSVNVEKLAPPAAIGSGGGGRLIQIPAIAITNAGIELGEHEGAVYHALRRVQMNGSFTPSRTERGGFSFSLHELSVRGSPASRAGFIVNGNRTQGQTVVTVENFSLDDWGDSSIPTKLRHNIANLDLKGSIPQAVFGISPEGGMFARLVMNGVAMNLPLEPDANFSGIATGVQGPLPQFVRMRGVKGDITFIRDKFTAKVEGTLEDLPYKVDLTYNGTAMDSPFECRFVSEDFRVSKNPGLLPYAPPKVREWLQLFTGPTALLTTEMTVTRSPPGAVDPFLFDGVVKLKEGTAAYAKFPYEFQNMAGEFRFDNGQVRVVEVRGISSSGATLLANGRIAPLDDSAEVRIQVQVRGAPIDEAMERAFGPERKQVLNALFNTDKWHELTRAGLVQTPAEALSAGEQLEERTRALASLPLPPAGQTIGDAIRAEIAEFRRRVAIPAFEFRGKADVDIDVLSPRGQNTAYQVGIDIRIPRAGLVPERFPIAVEATDVVVRVDTDAGRLVSGNYRALSGGTAKVDASFRIPARDEPDVSPEITIVTSDLVFGPMVIHALPGAPDSTVKRLLTDLAITATGKATVRATGRADEPGNPLGFDAVFSISGARAAPAPFPGAPPMRIDRLEAAITASEHRLDARISGDPTILDAQGVGTPAGPAPLSATIHADFGAGEAASTYRADVSVPDLSLSAPAESLLHIFAPAAADKIRDLRATYSPRGSSSIGAVVKGTSRSASPTVAVQVEPRSEVTISAFSGNMVLAPSGGTVLVDYDRDLTIRCRDLAGMLGFDGDRCGAIRLDGLFPTAADAPDVMRATLDQVPMESNLVTAVLRDKLSADNFATVADLAPRGLMDATLLITPDPATMEGGRFPSPWWTVLLRPKTLTIDAGDTGVVFPSVEGEVEIDGPRGIVRGLTARAAEWWLESDGAWEIGADGSLSLRTQLSGAAQQYTQDLRAALPAGLRDVLDNIALKVEGPMSLDDATLALSRTPDHTGDWTRFSGAVGFTDASLDAGASISGLDGRTDVTFAREPADASPRFNLEIRADRFHIGGVSLDRGNATVRHGAQPGAVEMPEAAGECYGGRFAARATIGPDLAGRREFTADTQLSGVRFGPLIAGLSAALKKSTTPEDPSPDAQEQAEAAERADFSRGLLDAQFTISGEVGRPETRRGRGSLYVQGGRVVNFPFMTRLVEVSNLAMPGNARLDFGRGDFYLDGGLITFEDLSIFSDVVQILGYGTMTWPGQILDLRFNSRSARPIPLISELLRGIRDELVTTTVTGKLGEQEVKLQQFPGTRRIIRQAAGSPPNARVRRIDEIPGHAAPPPHQTPGAPRPGFTPIPANPPNGPAARTTGG